ncbi:MAG: butyrate kinase, partial [Mucinivorans sp.]
MNTFRILAINPGSTSTKIAIYDNESMIFGTSISHNSQQISNFTSVSDQFAFRRQEILEAIKKAGIELASINTVVGRGGLLHPMTSGVYEVN